MFCFNKGCNKQGINACPCNNVTYCSDKCQKEDWEDHKDNCRISTEINTAIESFHRDLLRVMNNIYYELGQMRIYIDNIK